MNNDVELISEVSEKQASTVPEQTPVAWASSPTIHTAYFTNFVSGIQLIIPSNLTVSPTGEPIAIVRLSPCNLFNIDYNEANPDYVSLMQLFPVQFPFGAYRSDSNFKIRTSNDECLLTSLIASHQYASGHMNVSVRISSNTGVSGQFIYAVANDLPRDWDDNFGTKDGKIKYKGWRTLMTLKKQAHLTKSFAVSDVSLVRHLVASVPQASSNKFLDVSNLLNSCVSMGNGNPLSFNAMTHFYKEDVLLIYGFSDLSLSVNTPLVFDFIFDFSQVSFHTPIQPRTMINPPNYFYKDIDINKFYYDWKTREPLSYVECSPSCIVNRSRSCNRTPSNSISEEVSVVGNSLKETHV